MADIKNVALSGLSSMSINQTNHANKKRENVFIWYAENRQSIQCSHAIQPCWAVVMSWAVKRDCTRYLQKEKKKGPAQFQSDDLLLFVLFSQFVHRC